MYGIFTYKFTYIWLIFMVNVGEYASPMDPMGYIYISWLIWDFLDVLETLKGEFEVNPIQATTRWDLP